MLPRSHGLWMLLLLLCPLAAAAQGRWFEVQIAGKPAGRAREQVAPAEGGGLATTAESQTLIARLEATLDLRVRARTTEGDDGLLRAVHVETDFSAQTTVSDTTFDGRVATVRERSGAAALHERTVPLDEPLLGPEALRRRSGAALQKPGDTLALPCWAPELGLPVHVRRTVLSLEKGAAHRGDCRSVSM